MRAFLINLNEGKDMITVYKFKSKWQTSQNSQPVFEEAQIIALYRFVYFENDELIEIESEFFYDVTFMAKALAQEGARLQAKNTNIEISILYYQAAKSFLLANKVLETGQLVNTAFKRSARHYVSPIQVIRSMDISLREISTWENAAKTIKEISNILEQPRAFDIISMYVPTFRFK